MINSSKATSPAFHPATRVKKQRGVGLIEILVTIVLLSIGFLAAARMQVQGIRFSQSAYHQSQAYFLASDMMNRMRANIDGVSAGNYDNIMTSASANDPQCDVQTCDAAQLAEQDAYDWSTYFHALGNPDFIPALPSSDSVNASATVIPVAAGLYSVQLTWSEMVNGQDSTETLVVNFAIAL